MSSLRKFSENLEIFRKSENFPKIWKFSENLEIFRKPGNFQKIWKVSENLKSFQKSEKFPKIWKWLGHVSSSLWSHVSRVTSLTDCSLVVFFKTGSQSVSESVSDKGTYRAVWGQLKINLRIIIVLRHKEDGIGLEIPRNRLNLAAYARILP